MIDPVENNLFDLPDYEHTHDETFQPLLPPDSPGGAAEGALLNGDPEGNQLTQNKDSSVTTRRAVKRTIPKLDAQRLSSERGLPALCNLFDNVNFKGKGHEKVAMADHITLGHCNRRKYESVAKHLNFDHVTMGDAAPVEADLKTLIRHMEHWAHRLFPQLPFEKVVERIESLGNKKPVQACLKRIRLDLPLSNEDFRSHEGEDENSRHSPAPEEPVFLPETQNSPKESGSPSLSPALTEEQQQRIERNRQRALERRQAKNQLSQSPNDDLPTSEEYGTIAAQEKDEVCIDKAGVPFQPTEDVRSSTDQVSF